MSNHGSDDDVDAEYEQDEEASDEADNDDNEDSYVGSSLAQTQQRSTRTSNVPPPTSPQRDLYSYAANMTDRQRREQDERNFARAVGRERRSEGIADGKRRIRFDARGNLQYSDDPERSEWQPAVFHHWIRRELAEASNRRGSYVFPRKAGREPGNSTSFVESQRQWGTQRQHYAPIMFQYEPPRSRTSPAAGPWLHSGRRVIDYWLRPLQNFQEIPQVLSSEYEGEFMEPSQRQNSRIKHTDFRQRMPPFVVKKGEPAPVTSANNLAKRNRMFRNRAGAIPWTKRDKASDKINAGSRRRVADPESQDSEEIDPRPPGVKPTGRKPRAAKSAAPEPRVTSPPRRRTKRKHVSSEEGSPPPPLPQGGLSSAHLPSIGGVLGLPARPKSGTTPDTSSSKPPKKKLETGTAQNDPDQEAESSTSSSSSSSDYNDRLYLLPSTPAETEWVQRLLQPTLAHYYDLTGFHIQDWDTTATYAEQVTEIERAMHRAMERRGRPRVDILRLDEFNDERAVWNLRWDEATYGAPLDLSGEVREQLDGGGRRWDGRRWV